MTTQTLKGEDFFLQLLEEVNKNKSQKQFIKNKIIIKQNNHLFLLLKFLGKIFFNIITYIYKTIFRVILFLISLYKPSVFFIDKILSLLILKIFKTINYNILILRSFLEKYIKRRKYDTLGQFEQNLKEIDIAYLVLGIGYHKKMTLHEIMEHFEISYHDAIRVNKMKKNKLLALNLISEDQKKIKNIQIINEAKEYKKEDDILLEIENNFNK